MVASKLFVAVLALLSLCTALDAKESPMHGKMIEQSFDYDMETDDGTETITTYYLLYVPKEYADDGKEWPLVMFLHGLGECGNNELDRVKIHGPTMHISQGQHYPFIVVAPQCPPPQPGMKRVRAAWDPPLLKALVEHVGEQLRVDDTRFYVTGLSMGGFGTWRFAATYPNEVAAVVPVCGGGDTAWAKDLANVPIWAFHGAKDNVVPPELSEKMVEAIKTVGGTPKLTIYPEANHNSWSETYSNQEVYDWLLSHQRTAAN